MSYLLLRYVLGVSFGLSQLLIGNKHLRISQDVWLQAADGIRLHAWFMWPSEWAGQEGGAAAQLRRRPVVLFFQENAGASGWYIGTMHTGLCLTTVV